MGDHNTRYFHRRATCRKQQKRITSLKLSSGEWCSNVAILREEAANYFHTLFTADEQPNGYLPISGWFPALPHEITDSLGDVPSESEIHDALMSMAPLKSPGWDGLHAEFFQWQWSTIPSLGPLYRYLRDPAFALSGLTFANVTTVDGTWGISRLFALFDTSTVAHILSVKSPCLDDVADQSLHVMRDCHVARDFWLQILPVALIRPFFDCNLQQWISCNLSATILHPQSRLSWKLVFASLVWQIWKRRNDLIFQASTPFTDMTIITRSLAWAKYYYEGAMVPKVSTASPWPVLLEVPDPAWIYLNVDGVASFSLSNGSIGGLFRNSNDDWIMGFAKAIGYSNNLQAELWALFEGLSLAWKQGFEKVLVRYDSKQVVDLVNSPSATSSTLSLVRCIYRLCQK
ncbi:hypothetical protein V6N11_028605 [Hibiscus sabdariffa]|uniref:RNase H type-1 domain-containing protein n=2 Tax=Hibiscus sabdariffa TaxID=183260 RepID=A0ABR2G3S3_9ROSI